jgi:hypothetical protein
MPGKALKKHEENRKTWRGKRNVPRPQGHLRSFRRKCPATLFRILQRFMVRYGGKCVFNGRLVNQKGWRPLKIEVSWEGFCLAGNMVSLLLSIDIFRGKGHVVAPSLLDISLVYSSKSVHKISTYKCNEY